MQDDYALREAVRAELSGGEKLLWVGKPTPVRAALQYSDSLLGGILVLVFLGVFVGFIMPNIFRFSTSSGSALFGGLVPVAFVSILLLSIFARPVWEFIAAGATLYAITDRRALIIKPNVWGGKAVKSYGEGQIQMIERHEVADGMGDIIFAREVYSVSSRYGRRTRTRNIGFFGIPNVRAVEDIMLQQFRGWSGADFSQI
jgi:hypothetical protein